MMAKQHKPIIDNVTGPVETLEPEGASAQMSPFDFMTLGNVLLMTLDFVKRLKSSMFDHQP